MYYRSNQISYTHYKMRNYDLKQVLWVEDDTSIIPQFIEDAENSGLELVPYCCWDDAKKALENDYDRWSAIILDAKCKHHRDSADSAVVFLREALKDISVLAVTKDRTIPWYVLTGGDTTEVSDSINDERLKWDKDWTDSTNKKYYSKNTDTEMLYDRIKYHAQVSPRLQIQKMYRNVFEAIEDCKIDDEAYNALEDLLLPIHFPDEIDAKDYNDKFQKARDVLEYVFRSMSAFEILPDWGKQVNLSASSHLLAGKDFTKKDGSVIVKSNATILPKELSRIMRAMVNIIPPFCHSDSGVEDNVSKKEYMNSVENSTFLLKSFALQFCDLILWYRNYLRGHSDKEENARNWEVLDENQLKRR